MQGRNFYITTPIYYVNDKPHIGHAYTTVLADVLTRYHRLLGDDAHFLTGTDEHGQKVQRAAEKNGVTPIEQCDRTVVRFQELWAKLGVAYDDFIRTTEERHKAVVRRVLQDLFDRGLIYKAEYKGMYCVPCERFFTEKDLREGGLCPDCGRAAEPIAESNYFFRMSQFQDWLVSHIKSHPEFIQPSFRANETLGFLKRPLGDLCVSRPKSRLSWGIELPFAPDYVCYVWFDALLNYVSAVGHLSDPALFARRWPATIHLIGKDILTTHTVYWPIMLKAMGVEPPRTVFAHGWWLAGDDKMSKSKGNVVDPMDMADLYGVDAFRYFLMAEMAMGMDANFTVSAFSSRYNSELANDFGNLLNRVVKMAFKEFAGVVPAPGGPETHGEPEAELRAAVAEAAAAVRAGVEELRLSHGLEKAMAAVRAGNKYIERSAPWALAKAGERLRLATALYSAAEAVRALATLLAPVMPRKMADALRAVGADPAAPGGFEAATRWGLLEPGAAMADLPVLFPRVEPPGEEPAPVPPRQAKPKAAPKPAASAPAAPPAADDGLVEVEEFFRSKLRTARVALAERVPGADKLLRLEIELDGERRQIVAGIAKSYAPEELLGKTIVVVSNLQTAKIRGLESRGMLLAAKCGDALRLVTIDPPGDGIPPGSPVG